MASYAWARGIDDTYPDWWRLSDDEREALEWAQKIDKAAQVRQTPSGRNNPELTVTAQIDWIAGWNGLSASTVRRRMAAVKIKLFSRLNHPGVLLSDRGIRYRKAHARTREQCDEEECDQRLPTYSTRRRRYCHLHAQPPARMARSRARRSIADRGEEPL